MSDISPALGVVFANEPGPQVSKDDLQLQKQIARPLVYLKPGATFSVAILEYYVEFGKNWARLRASD